MLLVVTYSRKWHSIAITIAIAIAILFHRGIGIAIAIFLICVTLLLTTLNILSVEIAQGLFGLKFKVWLICSKCR